MILGRGTAQTQEAIIAEYHQFLEQFYQSQKPRWLAAVRSAPVILCRQIGKSPFQWTDDDILSLYTQRGSSSIARYNVFLAFLFFRGYYQPGIPLLLKLPLKLAVQWKQVVAQYHERVNRTTADLGYEMTSGASAVVTILLCLLITAGKSLEEITRPDARRLSGTMACSKAAREKWVSRCSSLPS